MTLPALIVLLVAFRILISLVSASKNTLLSSAVIVPVICASPVTLPNISPFIVVAFTIFKVEIPVEVKLFVVTREDTVKLVPTLALLKVPSPVVVTVVPLIASAFNVPACNTPVNAPVSRLRSLVCVFISNELSSPTMSPLMLISYVCHSTTPAPPAPPATVTQSVPL